MDECCYHYKVTRWFTVYWEYKVGGISHHPKSLSSAPHVLCPPELVDDARGKNEEILQEKGHSRIGRLKVVDTVVSDVNILSKQNVATPLKKVINNALFVRNELPMKDPNPIMNPTKNHTLAPKDPKHPSVNPSPLRRLLETALTMNMEMVEKTPQRWK